MNENNLYKKIDPKIRQKINMLLDNGYEQAALGTMDGDRWPLVTKVIPLLMKNNIYMLLSDLSEHTKNIINNPAASLYFAAREHHRSRSNNVRLTLQGTVTKLNLNKKSQKFKNFVEKHSELDIGSEMWAYFEDFNFYEFHEKRQLYIEGYAKAYEGFIK